MQFGFFNDAESLGYDSVWVTDSQMIFSDCYAVLALAARQTRRIRLGPGTAICGTRIPPVHAAAMATLNRLAPGRVHLGIGTGNTAMRTMGQRRRVPARAGRPAARRDGGLPLPRPRSSHLGLEPKIPLYVSGFGPRAMELAGKHGDGLVFAIPPRGVAVAEALGHAREGAARAGRALDGFRNCALTNVALLEPGEPVDSPRVVRTVGPNVMAAGVPASDLEALLRARGRDARRAPAFPHGRVPLHLSAPRRGRVIDASLIRATCLVGTADALVEQVRELERQGLQELMFAIGVDEKWRVAEAFARGGHRAPVTPSGAPIVMPTDARRGSPGRRRGSPPPDQLRGPRVQVKSVGIVPRAEDLHGVAEHLGRTR